MQQLTPPAVALVAAFMPDAVAGANIEHLSPDRNFFC
jgi:hypothetical protein